MIAFCIEAYEGVITTTTVFTPMELNSALANAEKYLVEVRNQVVAGTPALTLKLERSNDGLNWDTTTPIVSFFTNQTLTGATIFGQDLGTTNVGGCFARLSIQISGASSSAWLKIILTGRDS